MITEDTFIDVYAIGMIILIVLAPFFFQRMRKLKYLGNTQGIKFPGGIFFILSRIDLTQLESEDTKAEIKRAIVELSRISRNTFAYFLWHMPCLINMFYRFRTRNILINVATCAKTFVREAERISKGQDKHPKISHQMSLNYKKGIHDVAITLNERIFDLIDDQEFAHRMRKHEMNIFASLYDNGQIDPKYAEKLRSEFRLEAGRIKIHKKGTLYGFLKYLEGEWVSHPDRLLALDNELLTSLFTIRNMLYHCYEKWPNAGELSKSMQEKLAKIIEHLRNLDEAALDQIMLEGLTYDKRKVVERTYDNVHSALNYRSIPKLELIAPAAAG